MSVFFQPRTALTKGAVEPTARGIAQAVSAVPVGTVDRTADVKVHWQALPPGIAHISIRRSIDGVDKLWHADAGGWVAQIGPEDVRAVLFTKNRMHAAARQRCDELWLVIVNDVFSRAAQAELTQPPPVLCSSTHLTGSCGSFHTFRGSLH